MPVAEYDLTVMVNQIQEHEVQRITHSITPGLVSSFAGEPTAASPPPAASAPGPAGFETTFFLFLAPALGVDFGLLDAPASSAARSLSRSALAASASFRFASFSSLAPVPFAPVSHFAASFLSYQFQIKYVVSVESDQTDEQKSRDRPPPQLRVGCIPSQPPRPGASLPRFQPFWRDLILSWRYLPLVPYLISN